MAAEPVHAFRGMARQHPTPVPTGPEAEVEQEPPFWEREYPELGWLSKERAKGCEFNCDPATPCRACELRPGPARRGWENAVPQIGEWGPAPGTYVRPDVIYDRGRYYSPELWHAMHPDYGPPPEYVEFDPDVHVPEKWPGMAARINGQGSARAGKPLDAFLAESTDGVQYIVDGLIAEGGMYAVVGRPETFKSFAATHLGFAVAGGATEWLGRAIGRPRPFVYVSNEKSSTTVRERFRLQTASVQPTEPVQVIHRSGATFGSREAWAGIVATVRELTGSLVVVDTLASLAGTGFDENSGKDMAVVLSAVRELVDAGGTVLLCHHPSKYGEGTGGVRMRGHTSLWGDTDGVLEFTRPDRAVDAGMVRAEPKDGDLALIPFRWSRDTFLVEADETQRVMTALTLADVVRGIYRDVPLSSDSIGARFPGHGRSVFMERLAEAVDLGLIVRTNRGKATRYLPGQMPDERVTP